MEPISAPATPTKRFLESQLVSVPPSPDMKHARNRLNNLLDGIRKGDPQPLVAPFREDIPKPSSDIEEDGADSRRGPGRPKKTRKEKKVVFELRGKSFDMRDVDQVESVYSMCRKWIYGKDDEKQELEELAPPLADDVSLDLLATKPIVALPSPDISSPLCPPRPPNIPSRLEEREYNGDNDSELAEIMANHLKHWRNVKKTHNEFSQTRKKRYEKCICLLRTVYNIAQQSQS